MDKVESLVNQFLDYLNVEKGYSDYTVKDYKIYLRTFLDFLSSQKIPEKKKSIEYLLGNEIINRYRRFLYKSESKNTQKTLQKTTQNYLLIALRSFLRFLGEKNLLLPNPPVIKLFKHQSKERQTLTSLQLDRLITAPDPKKLEGLRDRSIMSLLADTGLLVSDLVALNKEDIDLDALKVGLLSFSGRAANYLESYLGARKDSFKPLFIRLKGAVISESQGEMMRLSARSVERMVEKYVRLVGLPVKATPLTLRHTFAVGKLQEDQDLENLQKVLNHKYLETTKAYLKLIPKEG